MTDEWTEKQKQALQRWRQKDDSDRHPHDLLPGGRQNDSTDDEDDDGSSGNDVQSTECAEMRRVFKANAELTIKAMAEHHFSYHRSTIAEHVFGRRCSHAIDETPAESPMSDINSEDFIGDAECAAMRRRWQEVREIVKVQGEFDKTYGQTYHHLAGRCKCENDQPDIRAVEDDD